MSREMVAQVFIDMHNEEHKYDIVTHECPLCNVLYEEVYHDFYEHMVKMNTPVVDALFRRWYGRSYCIANKFSTTTELSLEITDIIMRNIKLKLPSHNFTPEDFLTHPYVIKKCKDITNAPQK